MSLKWGILSAGFISDDFATASKLLKTDLVVAVAARKLECAKIFAEKHGIPKAYGSYEELATDKEIDVVYVGTINPQHESCVRLLLEHDKHVLCEKPFMMNMRETSSILQLAKERKKFVMEAVWSRFFPAYARVRQALADGAVGDIKFVHVNFIAPAAVGRPRITEKELGGGGILDLGIYCVQFITMVMGEKPGKIVAVGQKFDTGVDRSACATLEYSGGRLAQFNLHTEAKGAISAEVVGTKGSIRMDEPFYSPDGVIINDAHESFPLPEGDTKYNFPHSCGLHYEMQAVGDAIRQGRLEHELMPHRDTEIICGVLDECRKQIGVVFECDQ